MKTLLYGMVIFDIVIASFILALGEPLLALPILLIAYFGYRAGSQYDV